MCTCILAIAMHFGVYNNDQIDIEYKWSKKFWDSFRTGYYKFLLVVRNKPHTVLNKKHLYLFI